MVILRFLEKGHETGKTRDTLYDILREMRKGILLEMIITYRKIFKTFVNIFCTQTYTYLSCQRENLNRDFSSGLKVKKALKKDPKEDGLSKHKLTL